MSEEKRMNPANHVPQAAPHSAGAALAEPPRAGSVLSGGAAISLPTQPDLHRQTPPAFAPVLTLFLGLLATINFIGWWSFGSQPMTDGAVVLSLILVCLGTHLYANHKANPVLSAAALLALIIFTWHPSAWSSA